MNSGIYWEIFLDTGAPEMYLLYNQARKTEETNVPDSQRTGSESYTLQ